MEGKKKPAAAGAGSKTNGSSIVDDLFGPKPDASNSSSSSASYFSTVFPTPSEAAGKDASRRAQYASGNKSSSSWTGQQQQQYGSGSPESPYFGSSSVHYGGRDLYTPGNVNGDQSKTHHGGPIRKHNKVDDGDTSGAATRGDWWQGSLYY
ncbi:uncharacterized protein LOC100840587 isoform X2 [Brachypodium distachyon]|uniref:uncharacterized protein LOC100840587 isoform X2 n=1 Tax=Brachypodium distachyon TaxID=15368 RepID=UPI000234E690|nr:uncharacterized protein LOC100840587 isoform X2 [Brachypodium distachyon]|eukprot:XP_014752054.1 uncharacterized protein LOC100840587 isoform X2 [Brachypodium distachyon]